MKIARKVGCCGLASMRSDRDPSYEIPILREDPYVSDAPELTVEEIVKLREAQGQDTTTQETPWIPAEERPPPIVPPSTSGGTGLLAALGAGLWWLLG